MRSLILSDLHANVEALDSVLDDARRQGFDRVVCLGDIVGYGASPGEVIDRLRALQPSAIVRGNHDKVVSGITQGETFHDAALTAALWTREAISKEAAEWLRSLPQGPMDAGGFVIAHGSPHDEEEYILGDIDAALAFGQDAFDIALFGHSHFTCMFALSGRRIGSRMLSAEGESLTLEPGIRYLLNPGSIGQPRDHNPGASYAILDDLKRTFEVRRVAYDVEGAQRRILDAGLPEVLAHRLALGV